MEFNLVCQHVYLSVLGVLKNGKSFSPRLCWLQVVTQLLWHCYYLTNLDFLLPLFSGTGVDCAPARVTSGQPWLNACRPHGPEGGKCLTINYFLSSFPAEANHCRYTALSQSPLNSYSICWQVGLLSVVHMRKLQDMFGFIFVGVFEALHGKMDLKSCPRFQHVLVWPHEALSHAWPRWEQFTNHRQKRFSGWCCCFYQVLGDFDDEWLMDPQTRLLMFHLFLSGHCRWLPLPSGREPPAGGIARNVFQYL